MILLLISCTPIGVAAQICLKLGVDRTKGALLSPSTAWRAALEPLIWIGALCYGLGTVIWIRVLTTTDLSFAYPFAGLTYAGGVLASQWLLKEKVTASRWAGLGLIILGVIFVAMSAGS